MRKNNKSRVKDFALSLHKGRLTTISAAWVYYFLTALVPLVFLLITAFSVFGVNISTELIGRLPPEFRSAGTVIIETAEQAHTGVTIFFILTVIISCSTLLNQMSKDGDVIYGLRTNHKRGVLRRVWAVVAIILLFALFMMLALLFTFRNIIYSQMNFMDKNDLLFTILTFSIAISFGYIIILMLNKFIAPVKLKFKEIAWGSLVSLFVVVLGTALFTLYLRFFSKVNLFYGSLTAVIVFLIWAYIMMTGLTTGVIINKNSYMRNKK